MGFEPEKIKLRGFDEAPHRGAEVRRSALTLNAHELPGFRTWLSAQRLPLARDERDSELTCHRLRFSHVVTSGR
jgi:hypothetical protein